ncbi:MAG: apolipoprotein N-acyltransferase [Verrucomicrobiales bacterium]|nr:apolipoprotein N-acyltransferase [Verrucomicrobiales bacterium]
MPSTPAAPPSNQIPLVVDLDGTLIKTDLLWEHLARLLRRNPFWLLPVLVWWMRGRAFLKKQLARRIKIDPVTLPYHEKFLAFLREQKSGGRKLILATASDLQMALPVASHVGLFDEVLGSDGKTNLRSENKLKLLTEKFGARGFDYAGNSSADFAVWRGSREAVVVNASPSVLKKAAKCTKPGPTFVDGYSPFTILKSVWNELFIRSGYLLAIVAGLLLAAAFPNPGIAGFAWVAPALMLVAALGQSGGDAFRVGYVAGISFWLASLYWLLLIPVAGYPVLGWVALSAFMALYFAVWTWLFAGKIGAGTWTRRNLWALAGAATWVGLEMIRARFLGGFPWNMLGTSQYQLTPLIQIAAVTGVYGVSFLVVWVSLSLFSAMLAIFSKPDARFAWQPEVFLPLLVVAILFATGSFQMRAKPDSSFSPAPLRITMIQPSVPQSMIWDSSANSNRFQQLLALTEKALASSTIAPPNGQTDEVRGSTDLLIWPESALPEFDEASYAAITNLVRAHHVWMMFNADDAVWRPDAKGKNDYDVFNSAFLFDPDGKFVSVYHKQKLVIFGEYIPLVRWLPFVKWLTPITGGYEAGEKPGSFELERRPPARPEINVISLNAGPEAGAPIKTAPLICFEDMFPQTARDSARDDIDFLVNLTNDGWFGEGAEQWQQAAAGIFRAVENGLPLVRSCNNGVTCWIDTHGRVRQVFKDATGGIYGPGWMTMELPLPAEKPAPTFYNRHGDWFGWGCVWVAVMVVLVKVRRNPSRKNGGT